MKSAQLEEKERSLREFVLILTKGEVDIIHKALMAYSDLNKRLKSAKKVLEDFESCSIFLE